MRVSITRGGRRGIDLEIGAFAYRDGSSSLCALRYPYAGARLQRDGGLVFWSGSTLKLTRSG